MRILVIPDIHLKPWMFKRAAYLMEKGVAEKAVCLMDIPDDWDQDVNLDLYKETFDKAIWFQNMYPDTLWCYGNHDLSYVWLKQESGFSYFAIGMVNDCMQELRSALPDERQMAYVHRIDNVLFVHGGLTRGFVERYASDIDYDDIDAVVERINGLGCDEMWENTSPIWFRPQFSNDEMYQSEKLLQVVGHTPVERFIVRNNVLSCDVFSTYRTLDPIGTQEFLLFGTANWHYGGLK